MLYYNDNASLMEKLYKINKYYIYFFKDMAK